MSGSSAGPRGSSSRGVKLSSRAKPGPVECSLVAAIEDAGDLRGEARVWAALALKIARLVDLAWRADEPQVVLRASTQLRELIDLLPIRSTAVPGDEDGEEDSGSDGSNGGTVLSLLDRAPSVGD